MNRSTLLWALGVVVCGLALPVLDIPLGFIALTMLPVAVAALPFVLARET